MRSRSRPAPPPLLGRLFYTRFRDKQELLRYLFEHYLGEAVATAQAVLRPGQFRDVPAAELVRQAVADVVRIHRARAGLVCAFCETVPRDPVLGARVVEVHREIEGRLCGSMALLVNERTQQRGVLARRCPASSRGTPKKSVDGTPALRNGVPRTMSRADTLRMRDVRDAYRLIGECRDLGSDAGLWHPHMMAGLARLLDATQVNGGECWWRRPHHAPRIVSAFAVSEDADVQNAFFAYDRERGQLGDPFLHALARLPGRHVVRRRWQAVSDATWFRSDSYRRFREPARITHEIMSLLEISAAGGMSAISLNRTRGRRDFTARERAVLRFFHAEIGRLIGGPLASDTEPAPDTLPPRLRQTLACLLEGDGEKQVAARLGISATTVHQYVTALYRRFGVSSRAQLLAHALRRPALGRWRDACGGRS